MEFGSIAATRKKGKDKMRGIREVRGHQEKMQRQYFHMILYSFHMVLYDFHVILHGFHMIGFHLILYDFHLILYGFHMIL